MMLAGLMSRWMSPAACASESAPQACRSSPTTRPAGKRPVEVHELLQVEAAQKLHGVVEDAVRRAPVVVDRNRARVRQARRQLDLALETGERPFALGTGSEQLHRGRPPEQRVPRLPDDAHGPVPEPSHQTVRPHLLSLALQAQDDAKQGNQHEAEEARQQPRQGDADRLPAATARTAPEAGRRPAATCARRTRPTSEDWKPERRGNDVNRRGRSASAGAPASSASRSRNATPEAPACEAAVSIRGATWKMTAANPRSAARRSATVAGSRSAYTGAYTTTAGDTSCATRVLNEEERLRGRGESAVAGPLDVREPLRVARQVEAEGPGARRLHEVNRNVEGPPPRFATRSVRSRLPESVVDQAGRARLGLGRRAALFADERLPLERRNRAMPRQERNREEPELLARHVAGNLDEAREHPQALDRALEPFGHFAPELRRLLLKLLPRRRLGAEHEVAREKERRRDGNARDEEVAAPDRGAPHREDRPEPPRREPTRHRAGPGAAGARPGPHERGLCCEIGPDPVFTVFHGTEIASAMRGHAPCVTRSRGGDHGNAGGNDADVPVPSLPAHRARVRAPPFALPAVRFRDPRAGTGVLPQARVEARPDAALIPPSRRRPCRLPRHVPGSFPSSGAARARGGAVRRRAPAVPRDVPTRPRPLALGRADDLDGPMGRRLSAVRGGRVRRALPRRRRPRVPRPVPGRYRSHDGTRAAGGRRGGDRAGSPRNDVHAADGGRRVAGRRAGAPLRPSVLAGRAHRDRRESVRHPARAPPHGAAEDPGVPLVLPRDGGRDVRDTPRRHGPSPSRQPRPPGRSVRDDPRRRVQRRARPRSRARRGRRRVRSRRAGHDQHRHRPSGARLSRGAARGHATDGNASHPRRNAHDLRRSRRLHARLGPLPRHAHDRQAHRGRSARGRLRRLGRGRAPPGQSARKRRTPAASAARSPATRSRSPRCAPRSRAS